MRLVGLLAAAACGRIGFDPGGHGPPIDDGALASDAVAVPTTVCSVTHAPATAPANADLAIAPSPEGVIAMWANTAGGNLGALRLDAQHAPIANAVLAISTDLLGGVVDAGFDYAVGVREGPATGVWQVPYDLSTESRLTMTTGITGRDPFPSDQNKDTRLFITASNDAMAMQYVGFDVTLSGAGSFTAANPITSLAGADGPSHSHVVWTEDIGGGASRCTAADVDYASPSLIMMGSMEQLSDDCFEIRNDTGPFAPDGMMIVWTTAAHTVEARYIVSTGNVSGQLSAKGRAPRVAYDGTRVWTAWIDERAGSDELHFAAYDLATGNISETALPGWHSAGDEAFELLRDGNHVYLAILTETELDLLELCG